jgi:hypothetical protein
MGRGRAYDLKSPSPGVERGFRGEVDAGYSRAASQRSVDIAAAVPCPTEVAT